jgi:hypothetical protein
MQSDTLIVGSYFNGGVRVHEISDPFRSVQVAHYIPAHTEGIYGVNINDLYGDGNGLIYAIDHTNGGHVHTGADVVSGGWVVMNRPYGVAQTTRASGFLKCPQPARRYRQQCAGARTGLLWLLQLRREEGPDFSGPSS